MPITKSAIKALRQAKKRNIQNRKIKEKNKTLLKEFERLIAEKNKDEANKLLPRIYQSLDRAAKIGILKKNAARRKKSRLTRKLK